MFTVQIDTNNEAFDDDMATEIIRLLRTIIDEVEHEAESGMLYDSNGNRVGSWQIS